MSRLAVLLAAYNGASYIAQQLDSLFLQTCQDFTVYIHDDGSEDNTVEIIEDYIKRYPGRICLLQYAPAGGAKENFFSLLQRAEAEYYMFCDEDDYWLPEKIKISMEEMERMERQNREIPCLVFSDMAVTDADLQITHPSYLQYCRKNSEDLSLKALLRENVAAGCTILCNRPLAEAAMEYQDSSHIFMHDWWLMVTAAALGRISQIKQPLVLYRQHGNNTVGAHTAPHSWLKRIVKNVLGGRQLASSREGICYQRSMAGELLGIVNRLEQKMAEPGNQSRQLCRPEDRTLLQELSEIAEKPYRQRIAFYRKYRLLKQNKKNFWKLLLV